MAIQKNIKLSSLQYNQHRENYEGICLRCHMPVDNCEPDAENYYCDECGTNSVQGIENLLIMGLIEIED